ncbi:hypothetical protein ACQV2E_04865 [Pantoea allii]|uniref:Uncharacterized protein n=1 Tax=Pantoea allii TaxID=574096 RepID=A0ABS6V9L5_9GAMM|nr:MULTISPECIES: hypothetical protein [Pantoea]MBW1212441.1 hypothetical protein [Pantoea allii]MBW1255921.1 hypothetical protein [Pantoea allii]MBW1264998.1 hypothetical protein [Pantoea allii]MBW1287115.1 hypothetical protein [Pantoea allii]MDJ0039041.1 hypothetical protein [Pantoea allii]
MKRSLQICLASLAGLAVGAGLFIIVFPSLARFINGPVKGEDQMSANAALLFIGLPATAIIFAAVTGTWWAIRLKTKAQSGLG